MSEAIVLDAHPLGLASDNLRKPEAAACFRWIAACLKAGRSVYVPEIADYEVRRELKRAGATAGIARLDGLEAGLTYLPLTTEAMRLAADLWAEARNAGLPTAPDLALDGDVILAAQALTLSPQPAGLLVATINVKHIARYLPAEEWQKIVP